MKKSNEAMLLLFGRNLVKVLEDGVVFAVLTMLAALPSWYAWDQLAPVFALPALTYWQMIWAVFLVNLAGYALRKGNK